VSYYDCYLIPVAIDRLDDYKRFSHRIATIGMEYGALRVVDCVLDPEKTDGAQYHAEDVQPGLQGVALRDFPMAAAVKQGETVVLSWTEWPDKATRDDMLPRFLADPRIQPFEGEGTVFEGTRLVAGSFSPLFEI
jgi:uncharacterized protein YbaA (DUF1428 family)